MSKYFTEADYENSLLELFENMGYDYKYGPNVERDFYTLTLMHRAREEAHPSSKTHLQSPLNESKNDTQ